jgi:3-oxoacyl-[acyl-carrier-protein] synthase-3
MQFGFHAVDYELPERISVENLLHEANCDLNLLNTMHNNGLKNIPQNTESTLDKLVNVVVKRVANDVFNEHISVEGVILAHSLPFLSPRNIPFIDMCISGIGIKDAFKIAVSGQPCSIVHQALQMSMTWLSKNDIGSCILLIGADQVYSSNERIYFNTAMGDSAFVGVVTNKPTNNFILSSVSETEIIASEGDVSSPEEIDAFRAKNPSLIRHCIENALCAANITMKDVRYIVPHTPYKSIWDSMAMLLKIPREKILDDYIYDTGHLNSNDTFCHYARACREKRLVKNDIAVLVNPGFGGSRGCTVVRV